MKLNLRGLVFLVVMSFAIPHTAWASRARVLTMGTGDGGLLLEGQGGSLYYSDSYNIFYNPAYINDYMPWAIIEKANGSTSSNHAQGGFFTQFLLFRMGFYFNRTQPLTSGAYAYNNNGNGTATRGGTVGSAQGASNGENMTPVEFFLGGQTTSFAWGIGLSYARHKVFTAPTHTETDTDANLSAGFKFGDFEPFLRTKIYGRENTARNTDASAGSFSNLKANHFQDYLLGMRYHYGEWVPFLAGRMQKKNALTGYTYGAGIGRTTHIAANTNMNLSIGYWRRIIRYELNQNRVPIDLSIESDVLSWLTLRGGLGFLAYSRSHSVSTNDSTSGRFGASLHIGQLDLDWAIGGGGTNAVENTDTTAFDSTNGFFTAASLSYKI